MQDYNSDYDPRYTTHITQRTMAVVRSTTIICLTAFVVTGMFLFFAFYAERFTIVASDQGVYVFDRKESHLNHCNGDGKCKTLILAKSPNEMALLQQQALQNVNGGFLSPMQQQPCVPNPSVQQPMNQGTSLPGSFQGQVPQEGGQQSQGLLGGGLQAPSNLLGAGLPMAPSTTTIQNQMNAAQQQVNTNMLQHSLQNAQPQIQPYMIPTQNSTGSINDNDTDSEDGNNVEAEYSNNRIDDNDDGSDDQDTEMSPGSGVLGQ